MKTDEELILLCVEKNELTVEAEEALRTEMSRRGLSEKQADEQRADREYEQRIENKKSTARELGSGGKVRYGKANRVLLLRTKRERFTTTVFFAPFAWFPLVPLATYRVEQLKKTCREKTIVLERLPLDWEQVLKVWVVSSGIVLLLMWAIKYWIVHLKR